MRAAPALADQSREGAAATNVNDSKWFAINAASPTPCPSSHRRAGRSYAAIALVPAAPRAVRKARPSRTCRDNYCLNAQQFRKVFSVGRLDLAGVADALHQFVGRHKAIADGFDGPHGNVGRGVQDVVD